MDRMNSPVTVSKIGSGGVVKAAYTPVHCSRFALQVFFRDTCIDEAVGDDVTSLVMMLRAWWKQKRLVCSSGVHL